MFGTSRREGIPAFLGLVVFFVVVESADIQAFRYKLGLTKADLHITLGFNVRDIHGVKKDRSTLVSGFTDSQKE